LTSSSKLKFYRISSSFASELQFNKDIYGVTDLECTDFAISPNCKYIAVSGREGVVKIFDYFMRGAAVPSCQAFLGHFKYPKKLYWSTDMRFIFSVGDGNGIFRWSFFGDRESPADMSKHYEEIEAPAPLLKVEPGEPTFNHETLMRQANSQVDDQLARYAA
jgi:WD40 repeat protein